MSKTKIGLVVLFGLVASLVLVLPRNQKVLSEEEVNLDLNTHKVLFYDAQSFSTGVKQADSQTKLVDYHIAGGIIPHHLYPSFFIADFFKKLVNQKPKTLIMVGPNHYEKGNFKALTSTYAWETAWGTVKPNLKIIEDLINGNYIRVDESVLPNDHAVAGILPYVKYYLPETTVVPILLSGTLSQKDTQALADKVSSYLSKDTLLITPVDFSHYLTNKLAWEKDALTLNVIKNKDYHQLFSLNNDYLDSPPAIGLILMVMEKLKKDKIDVYFHNNSGEMQNSNFIPTTSYFCIGFH